MTETMRSLARRLAVPLATIQVAAFALVPVVEALFERAPGPASVEAAHEHCVVVHQTATCPACALAGTRARPAERVRLRIAATVVRTREGVVAQAGPSRVPSDVLNSRAPPSHAA